MPTYNTGNPVGSTDPRDLYDNAQSLDLAVNSDKFSFVDRRGVKRLTLKGYEDLATTADIGSRALLGDEPSGLAIDAQAIPESNQVIAKNDAGQIVFRGALDDLVPGSSNPKMVQHEDGSIGWANHNLFEHSDNLTEWDATNIAVEGGFLDSEGGDTAFRLEGVNTSLARILDVISNTARGRWHRARAIARAGTSRYAYISIRDSVTMDAFFDLEAGELGSFDAGLEAYISAYDEQGYKLPDGFLLIEVRWQPIDASPTVDIGPTDSDGNRDNAPAGSYIYLEKPHAHFGYRALPYYENPLGEEKSSIAFDWSRGEKMALFMQNSSAITLYADDLTQTEWAKTNCTATFDQTGPHGETCSRLTATAAGATCTQSTADSGTDGKTSFSALLKPSAGHGVIEMTTDGTTWVDITDQLDSTSYTRVFEKGAADPVVGFRIATSGDTLDVALATAMDQENLTPPLPVYGYGAGYTRDPLSLSLAAYFTPSGDSTLYASLHRDEWKGYNLFIDSPTDSSSILLSESSGRVRLSYSDKAGQGQTANVYHAAGTTDIDITLRAKPGRNVASLNGEPLWPMVGADEVISRQVEIGNNDGVGRGSLTWLRSFLVVPRAVPDTEVPEWRYRRPQEDVLRGSALVAYHAGVPDTSMNREPVVTVLKDDGESADLMVAWMQKHEPGHHVEAPARLMQRNYRYHKADDRLVTLTEASVLYEHAGWSDGDGHNQSVVSFVVPSGEYKGRVVALFSVLDGPDFTSDRDVYATINDQAGDPLAWTPPALVVDASAIGETELITEASGSFVVLPANHPVAPGRLVSVVYGNTKVWSLYTDNFGGADGTDWTLGTAHTGPVGETVNETNVALLPDGRLIQTHRLASSPTVDRRAWSLSDDGGVSFVPQGLLPSWVGSKCSASLVQLDPSGVLGPVGRLAMSRPVNNLAGGRSGTRIDFATDDTFEFKNYIDPWTHYRYIGYSSMKPLFGGSHLALSVEGGTEPFNVNNSAYLAIIKVPDV